MYKTYVKPSMFYVRMAGGLGAGTYKEACRRAGLNTIQEDLEEADMVRVYIIMNGL